MKNYQALGNYFIIAVPDKKRNIIIPEGAKMEIMEGEFHEILSIAPNMSEHTGLKEGDEVMINFHQGKGSTVPFKLDGKSYFSVESFCVIGKKVGNGLSVDENGTLQVNE